MQTGSLNKCRIMEEDADGARVAALASVRSDLSVSVKSNGHALSGGGGRPTESMRISVDVSQRRVDPLKIRVGTKSSHNLFGDVKKQGPVPFTRIGDRQTDSAARSIFPRQRMPERGSVCGSITSKATKRLLGAITGSDIVSRPRAAPHGPATGRKGKPQLKDYAQSLGLQPTVKFKCRKCSSMSKSLAMLKEHQRLCKATGGGQAAPTPAAPAAPNRVTRKVYLCSACSTYYENWNLFLHMREVHNRHICLFCLGMFSKAEKLALHLVGKHGVAEHTFRDKEEFCALYEDSIYLMCCFCDKLYTEKDNFALHMCNVPSVPLPVLVSRKLSKDISVNENISHVSDSNGPKTDVTQSTMENVKCDDPAVTEQKTDELVSPPTSIVDAEQPPSSETSSSLSSESMNVSHDSCVTQVTPEVKNISDSQEAEETQNLIAPTQDSDIKPDADSCSESSEDEDTQMDVDPGQNENNNISLEKERDIPKEREGGIKLKLSLNNALSPVIINSTVRPNSVPKPQFRPNRPPKISNLSPSQLPPLNNVHTTIYDNNLEENNTMNRVPKLTVRVPKGLLDKESSSDETSDSDASDKLTVDDTVPEEAQEPPSLPVPPELPSEAPPEPVQTPTPLAEVPPAQPTPFEDDVALTELTLDRPLDKYPLKELVKVFLGATMYHCVYCNHARKIAVNCEQLALHMLEEHRFRATVDSITAEELLPETIQQRVRADLSAGHHVYINLDTYDNIDPCRLLPYVRTYECFQCYFITTVHKELYLHNRKMHQKTILLCVMCKSNFYSYSELLCHLCPGTYDPEYEMRFRCCMCNADDIPSAFRLMVHLRKVHHACDVCTEACGSQATLSTHVWKHKLHHLCYRCGIAYRNKADITKHLFWKHGTQSILCKRCLQKKWPHVYHFCIPPNAFVCEECNLSFTRAVCLKVHKRLHAGNYPHPCLQKECNEKFVSKKLLLKHMAKHDEPKSEVAESKDEVINQVDDQKVDTKQEVPEQDKKGEKSEEISETVKPEPESPEKIIKVKKKKNKDKDSFLLDVNLPALNLSESDSSDDSEVGPPTPAHIKEPDVPLKEETSESKDETKSEEKIEICDEKACLPKTETLQEEKPSQDQALDIWDNFKQYQAKVEKQKTPPLVLIRKHVCESDHDYCLIPNNMNGEGEESPGKRQKKRSPKKRTNWLSTSSSSSSSSSCCSRGSRCSCSSSSRSSSSSSDSEESARRRGSDTSAVDVMALEEPPVLIPEIRESPIAESDLDTDESDTDEEFYDEHPQRLANKLYAEKRNQLMLLASVAPSDNGSVAGDASRPPSPEKERSPSKKKSKTKKRKRSKREGTIRKMEPIKLNIPKERVGQPDSLSTGSPALIPNKITISLQSNTVQIPQMPKFMANMPAPTESKASTSHQENKRASKRRRVPNKFYGYSSDEDNAVKPYQAPKFEWRKEDLPSPVLHKPQPTATISHRFQNFNDPIIRMSTPIPDPVPPPILMNTESMDSSESDSSGEYTLKIDQPNIQRNPIPVPPAYVPPSSVDFPKPAGVREAREGESVYCYCRCPYDEVSEMIACDAIGCAIEWFHFECVGIMVPPKGKWYCPDCRARQGIM